jgi:ribonucleoside-diphosphate reductase alpha chain
MSSAANVIPSASVYDLSAAQSAKDAANSAGYWPRVFTTDGVHPFDQVEWKIVDAEIRNPSGDRVFFQKDVEVPAWWSQNAVNVVADKYFRVINGVRESSVKQIFLRVAAQICRWASEQNYFNTKRDAQTYQDELLYALVHQYGAFNSPVWFNLGIQGRPQAASACFISSVDDSLDDIIRFQESELTIFRGGSGSGANLSNLRSSYERLSAGSYTSGPMSFMKGNDQFAGAMKSGGATRNAAKMVVMDMDHPDILETKDGRPGFIRCKASEEKLAHDLVSIGYSASYDDPNGAYKRVAYQNANHSVSIPDSFMQAVIDDSSWHTKERVTGKVVHTYKARELWGEIAKAAWACGDPGVQFNDLMNNWHTVPKSGKIRATNPCSEFAHIDDTACNLCAVNLTKFFDGRKFCYDRFAQAVRVFSTAQMAIVEMADYPTERIRSNSSKLRPIGTNYGDLGALLMKLGFGYDSDEGRAVAARMASLMTGVVYLTAAKLAARVGTFSEFDKNRDDMLRIMRMHQDADSLINKRWNQPKDPLGDDVSSRSADLWKEVLSLGEKHGFSISQATLQAPLGTISFLMGMSTTGIEPAFSLVSYKSLVGGGQMKLVNSGVRDALQGLGYAEDAVEAICKHVEESGSIEGAPGLNSEHLSVFDCAMPSGPSGRYLTPMAHIKMMAAIQPLITCAQSKTVNLPRTCTPEEIADIYQESWRLGVKCVALYRDGCKASQPLSTGLASPQPAAVPASPQPAAVPSAVVPSPALVQKPASHASRREKMPSDVRSWRHKFLIDGFKGYIIVSEYPDGRPGEVFLKLGKPGSTISGLVDGFTQMMSIGLQYGIPLPKIIASFVETRFEPAGMTANPNIRFATSIFDYLAKVLDVRYYKGQHSGISDRLLMSEAKSKEEVREGIAKDAPSSEPPPLPEDGRPSAKSLDAPPCGRCGAITQRNGSCYLCPSCGNTTGCS